MKKITVIWIVLGQLFFLTACSPEVGSEAWCEMLAEKPKGEWSANEAGNYTKHCLFR